MKKIIILAFLLATTFLFAQVESYKKIYLDSTYEETTKGNHKYYRIIKDYYQMKLQYDVIDYYADGHVKSEKTCRNKEGYYPIGSAKEYYPSGKIKNQKNYNNDFELYGLFYSFYENGNKEIEGEYVKIKTDVVKEHVVLRILSYWNENEVQKVIDGNGLFIDKSEFETSRGKLVNGLKTGIWTGYNSMYKLQFIDQFESGIFLGGVSKNQNNEEFGYTEIQKLVDFKGGAEAYEKHFEKNYKVPDIKEDIKSKVLIKFNVDKDGQVLNPTIKKGFNEDFDKEALKFIKTTNRFWSPYEFRGVQINYQQILPINVNIRTNVIYK